MPKLLIPFYAIDEQAFTAVATPSSPAAIVDTFELKCALDCDMQNYFWWSNDYSSATIHQPIVWTYTALATMAAEIAAKFGASAVWAQYVRIAPDAYYGIDSGTWTIIAPYSNGAKCTSVYGDIATDGVGGGNCYMKPLTYTKQINGHDGQFVMVTSEDGTDAEHSTAFFGQAEAAWGNYKLYHIIDGLLVDLPFTPDARDWSEIYEGGDLSTGPYGKVLHSGYKNVHMDRGKRRFTILFPEIPSTVRYNPASKYDEAAAYTNTGVSKLLECFKAGKGIISMLYMHDTADTGTWSVCRFVSLNTSEPEDGLWSAEATFEEY